MSRAVFLDRDGVINRLAFNPVNSQYESPHKVEDFELYPWTLDSLSRLQQMDTRAAPRTSGTARRDRLSRG